MDRISRSPIIGKYGEVIFYIKMKMGLWKLERHSRIYGVFWY